MSILRRTIDRSVQTLPNIQVTIQKTVCIEPRMRGSVKRVPLSCTEGGGLSREGKLVIGVGARREVNRELLKEFNEGLVLVCRCGDGLRGDHKVDGGGSGTGQEG